MREDLAKQVTLSREHKGWTTAQLAEAARIPLAEVEALEAGAYEQLYEWTVMKVQHLADALGLNMSQMLGEPILTYDEWALVWSALIEYSANRPGLNMKTDMKDLVLKVRSFIPDHQIQEDDG